jgi:hypothetical protein
MPSPSTRSRELSPTDVAELDELRAEMTRFKTKCKACGSPFVNAHSVSVSATTSAAGQMVLVPAFWQRNTAFNGFPLQRQNLLSGWGLTCERGHGPVLLRTDTFLIAILAESRRGRRVLWLPF